MKQKTNVDPKEMIALEAELAELKAQYGIREKQTWLMKFGDWLAERATRTPRHLNRKKYIRLALLGGWLCGAHRFYCGQKILGILYLLFCWTGIPIAMTLVDLMIVLPMKADQDGNILI